MVFISLKKKIRFVFINVYYFQSDRQRNLSMDDITTLSPIKFSIDFEPMIIFCKLIANNFKLVFTMRNT